MQFRRISGISGIEIIARGTGVREQRRLRRAYGGRGWRKLKGFATVELASGKIVQAELHWYEAHGVGAREMKLKRFW